MLLKGTRHDQDLHPSYHGYEPSALSMSYLAVPHGGSMR